jgi:hypothetical protein
VGRCASGAAGTPAELWGGRSVAIWIGIEVVWNIFPATAASSALLLALHVVILAGLWFASPTASGKAPVPRVKQG